MNTVYKRLSLLILALVGSFFVSPSIAGHAPTSLEYEGLKLELNGQGSRVRFFMKIYESSLYLPSPNSNAKEIINKDEQMAIRMDVLSSLVTVGAMLQALNEGFEKATGGNTSSIDSEIKKLAKSFNSDVVSGDYYEFIYLPTSGLNVLKNSEYIDTISGLEFKKAFFGIWLSDNPIQKDLKAQMLGG